MKLTRPNPIEFELADGRTFVVQPPTRRQIRAVIALDPEAGDTESPDQADQRRAKQLAILTEGSGLPIDDLTALEEMEILNAVIVQHHGGDPAQAVALLRVAKKKAALQLVRTGSPHSMPTPSRCVSSSTAE